MMTPSHGQPRRAAAQADGLNRRVGNVPSAAGVGADGK